MKNIKSNRVVSLIMTFFMCISIIAFPTSVKAVETVRSTGGTVTASGNIIANEGCAKAFDGNTSTKWYNNVSGSSTTSWIRYEFADNKDYSINKYTMISANDSQGRDPKSWRLQGSNDDSNWVTLDTQENISFSGRFTAKSFNFTNNTAYKYYRFDQMRNSGASDGIQLSEIKLIEDIVPTTTTRGQQTINILEVQPGRNWELSSNTFTSANFSGKRVILKQMSMAEFISTIGSINGTYDIVYFGDKEGSTSPSTGGKYNALGAKISGNEYYTENDITSLKVADVKSYIDSNQCIVFNSKIFSDNSLSATKLNTNFESYVSTQHPNVMSVTSIDSTSILNTYNNLSSKRPVVNAVSMPVNFDGTTYAARNMLDFNFQVTNINSVGNSMTANLYLDVNGDGLYSESTEKVTSLNVNISGNNYPISYRIPDDFTGVMPWKLEITDNVAGTATSRPKSTIIGATAFRNPSKPLVVRVLQLIPSNNTFDLSRDLKSTPLRLPEIYDIQVTKMRMSDFRNVYRGFAPATKTSYGPNGDIVYTSISAPTTLNGNYDMVLIGFADMYNKNDMTDYAVKEINSFIATKQSVMFTHDTIAEQFCPTTTSGFRDIVGQSRYVDSNNTDALNPDGTAIKHDPNPKGSSSIGYTYPRQNNVHAYDSTLVHKVNDGIITQFPYPLGDIPISKTHPVYYQLNFADPSVIPWYTIDNGTDNKYNSRDYYYTYSKGNITYSGSGDHAPVDSESESKLFVNTMIKAAKSANHAPIIKVSGVENGQNVSTSQANLNFSFVVTDIDNDAITSDVLINNTNIESYNLISGQTQNISINKAQLASIVGSESTFKVTFKAKDSKNAEAQPLEYTLNYVKNAPVVNLNNVLDRVGCLVGDNFNMTVNSAVSSSDTQLKTTISGAKFSIGDHNGVTLNTPITWDLLDFKIDGTTVTPANQNKTFNFTALNVGTHTINDSITYKYDDVDKIQPSNSSIDVKTGSINFRVIDNAGELLTKAVNLHVIKNDKTEQVVNVANGIGSLQNLASDSYQIIADIPKGYTFVKGTMKPYDFATGKDDGEEVPYNLETSKVDLSYNNGSPLVTLTLDAAAPVVKVTHNPPNNLDATANTDHPVTVTVDFDPELVKAGTAWYSRAGGDQIKYTAPFLEYTNITILAGVNSLADVPGKGTDTITNINTTPPTGDVTYDITTPTKGSVVATISAFTKNGVEATDITVANNGGNGTSGGKFSYTFTENGSFDFDIVDALGIHGSIIATVGNIDTTNPTLNFIQNPPAGTWGRKNITIIATASDEGSGVARIKKDNGAWVDNSTSSNSLTVNFDVTENRIYQFTTEDKVGNTYTKVYKVSNIDNVNPMGTIHATRNISGGFDLVLSVTDNASKPDKIMLSSGGPAQGATYTIPRGTKTYIFYFVDEAGNLGSADYDVDGLKER